MRDLYLPFHSHTFEKNVLLELWWRYSFIGSSMKPLTPSAPKKKTLSVCKFELLHDLKGLLIPENVVF